jgi:hypothetical protein
MMPEYQKKNRARKWDDDKEGLAPRLTELIKWARWSFYCLVVIAGMASLFFVRDALTVILRLFGV